MNKKLSIGIIVIFVGMIVAAASIKTVFIWPIIWVALIVAWIYLVWMVRKKKTKIFHEQMEPKLAERRLKLLKGFLLAGGISLAMFIVGCILYNVIYALSEEEAISFFVALSGGLLLLIANIGSLVILRIGQRKPT